MGGHVLGCSSKDAFRGAAMEQDPPACPTGNLTGGDVGPGDVEKWKRIAASTSSCHWAAANLADILDVRLEFANAKLNPRGAEPDRRGRQTVLLLRPNRGI
jgi:hypothetical protein